MKDLNQLEGFIIQELSGPFQGLSPENTVNRRALPPGPNAAPLQWNTEFNNVDINPLNNTISSRKGVSIFPAGHVSVGYIIDDSTLIPSQVVGVELRHSTLKPIIEKFTPVLLLGHSRYINRTTPTAMNRYIFNLSNTISYESPGGSGTVNVPTARPHFLSRIGGVFLVEEFFEETDTFVEKGTANTVAELSSLYGISYSDSSSPLHLFGQTVNKIIGTTLDFHRIRLGTSSQNAPRNLTSVYKYNLPSYQSYELYNDVIRVINRNNFVHEFEEPLSISSVEIKGITYIVSPGFPLMRWDGYRLYNGFTMPSQYFLNNWRDKRSSQLDYPVDILGPNPVFDGEFIPSSDFDGWNEVSFEVSSVYSGNIIHDEANSYVDSSINLSGDSVLLTKQQDFSAVEDESLIRHYALSHEFYDAMNNRVTTDVSSLRNKSIDPTRNTLGLTSPTYSLHKKLTKTEIINNCASWNWSSPVGVKSEELDFNTFGTDRYGASNFNGKVSDAAVLYKIAGAETLYLSHVKYDSVDGFYSEPVFTTQSQTRTASIPGMITKPTNTSDSNSTNPTAKYWFLRTNLRLEYFLDNTEGTANFGKKVVVEYPVLLKLKSWRSKISYFNPLLPGGEGFTFDLDDCEWLFLPSMNKPYTGEWFSGSLLSLVENSPPWFNQFDGELPIPYQVSLVMCNHKTSMSTHVTRIYGNLLKYEEGVDSTNFTNFDGMGLLDIVPFGYNYADYEVTGGGDQGFSEQCFWNNISPNHLGPSPTLDNIEYLPGELDPFFEGDPTFHSTGPLATKIINRADDIYLAGLLENESLIYSSSGGNIGHPRSGWPTSFTVNFTGGDTLTNIAALDNAVYIFSQNELWTLQGDFSSNTVRLDNLAKDTFGCNNFNSLIQTNFEIYFINSEGNVCRISAGKLPEVIRGNHFKPHKLLFKELSNIKDISLSYADKKVYINYRIDSNLSYSYTTKYNNYEFFSTFVLDTESLVLSTISDVPCSRGIKSIGGVVYGLGRASESSFTFTGITIPRAYVISRFNSTGTNLDYSDNAGSFMITSDIVGPPTTPIKVSWASDYQGAIAPSILKKLNGVSILRSASRTTFGPNLSEIPLLNNDEVNIYVEVNPDYYDNKVHSSTRMKLSSRHPKKTMKGRPGKLLNGRVKIRHAELYRTMDIHTITLELAPAYKRRDAKWIRGRR